MQKAQRRKRLPEVEREKVVNLSQKTLWSDDGKEALSYLKDKRGFSDSTLKCFGLGYVPRGVTNSYGMPHEFAGRIVITIRDQNGTLVALSSRDWRENSQFKFWHEQYPKSDFLFGLDVSKKSFISNNKAIVVEGEFDVIQLNTRNIVCVVGLVGSSICLKQIATLSRYCKEIFFVFDGDTAGKNALERAKKISRDYRINSLYEISMIPVMLPDNDDPDDFIKKNCRSGFINLLKEAKKNYIKV